MSNATFRPSKYTNESMTLDREWRHTKIIGSGMLTRSTARLDLVIVDLPDPLSNPLPAPPLTYAAFILFFFPRNSVLFLSLLL